VHSARLAVGFSMAALAAVLLSLIPVFASSCLLEPEAGSGGSRASLNLQCRHAVEAGCCCGGHAAHAAVEGEGEHGLAHERGQQPRSQRLPRHVLKLVRGHVEHEAASAAQHGS
jgi:hypothetical protein